MEQEKNMETAEKVEAVAERIAEGIEETAGAVETIIEETKSFGERVKAAITVENVEYVVGVVAGWAVVGLIGFLGYAAFDKARTSLKVNKKIKETWDLVDQQELAKNLAKHPEAWLNAMPVVIEHSKKEAA